MKNTDRAFFSELILILAGFMLAETLIRKYLEFTDGVTAWWVLPLIAISLIAMAIRIRNGERDKVSTYSFWGMILLLILFVGLFNREIISGMEYIWLTLGIIFLHFLIIGVEIGLNWHKKFTKKPKR